MSSGVSGSFSCAVMAASELAETFPERKIRLVDTLGASLGEGLIVARAAEYRDEGMPLEENAERLERLSGRMCQVFTVDELSYLRRSGRLSGISTIVGTMLNIKPILKGNTEGKIICFSKVRGRGHAVEFLAKQYELFVADPRNQTIGIAHADCPEDAERLKELINETTPPREIMTVVYEPVTGSHVGPGTLALFFIGNDEFRKLK